MEKSRDGWMRSRKPASANYAIPLRERWRREYGSRQNFCLSGQEREARCQSGEPMVCINGASHSFQSRCSIVSIFLFYHSTAQQYLDQSLSLAAPNEPFLGRPFNLFASCVEVEWRLKRRIAFRVVFPQRATARLILDLHSPYSYSSRVSHRSVAPCVPTSAHFSSTSFFIVA
jgi:hypothetical protein